MISPHIFIVGETASGKSSFSLACAQELDCEIINTDSLLFYKGLDIGTAKPSVADRHKVKHHLIDVSEIGEELTAADFVEQARVILKNDSRFLCVGGSGFYVRALDVGLLPLPKTSSAAKEKARNVEDPVSELSRVDPVTLETLSVNDLYRVRRALEVFFQTGKPLSEWKRDFDSSPQIIKVGFHVPREVLALRVESRARAMLKNGLIEETNAILNKLHGQSWKPLESVGYKQICMFLRNEIASEEELIEEICLRTMQLAKKQRTWFRGDASVKWFDHTQTTEAEEYIAKTFEENKWKV